MPGIRVSRRCGFKRVGFLADGQLIYLDIEASQLQLGHRLTVAFDAAKDPQSGPATLLVQLVYRDAEGVLNYAGMLRFCLDRHGRAINMAFVDGHVDAVPLSDLWQLKWHRTFEVTGGITIP